MRGSDRVVSHHATMTRVREDDLVLHYAKGLVRAASVVRLPARETTRPPELPTEAWEAQGYLVELDYYDAPAPIALEEIPTEWRTAEGGPGPFNRHGGVKQGYLFPLSDHFATR